MQLNRICSALAITTALTLSACSSSPDLSTPYTVSSDQETAEGSIIHVDKSNRMITIRGAQGDEYDVYAADEVRNFDQLQVGDRIALSYTSAIAVDIQPAGSTELAATLEDDGSTAEAGAKPGASASETATVVTEVTAVDTSANTISLKGPRGNEVTLDVAREDLRAALRKVKVGDLLRVTYSEAVAVNITPRP